MTLGVIIAGNVPRGGVSRARATMPSPPARYAATAAAAATPTAAGGAGSANSAGAILQ